VLQCLLACVQPAVIHDITLDLSRDPVADEYFVKDNRAQRHLLVFRPAQVLQPALRESILSRSAADFSDLRAGLPVRSKAYNFGDTIHFQTGSDARRFLTSGWSGVEPRHVWGTGRASKLELEISGLADNAGPFGLRLELVPFLVAGKLSQQRLAIVVNGTRLFKGKIQAEGPLDVPVTRELLLRRQPVQIVLIHPDGKKPLDLLANTKDPRVLSIGLRSIALINRAETA
jgi:hypothetical protein